jgi:hypothetical protein
VSTNPIAERHVRFCKEREKQRKTINKERLGLRVTTYRAVYDLAHAKGSVAVPAYGEILPAAWIFGMQFASVCQRMESGMFVYRKAVAK